MSAADVCNRCPTLQGATDTQEKLTLILLQYLEQTLPVGLLAYLRLPPPFLLQLLLRAEPLIIVLNGLLVGPG